MKKGRSRVRWTKILGIAGLALAFGVSAWGVEALREKAPGRADLIMIDTLKAFGDLERPEVAFLHDRHTDALEKAGKDCSACHLSEKRFKMIPDTLESAIQRVDHLSTRFKRLREEGRREVMDIYHNECIGCHNEMADSELVEKSGPVTCGQCHKADPGVVSIRAEMGMDQSLHYRHVKARDKKCEQCHHKYDPIREKLFYAKGEEGTCRYCHKDQDEENRVAMPLAAHIQCLDCHRKTLAENKDSGPVRCAGCHDPARQKAIEKVSPLPRMERNQPDAVVVRLSASDQANREMASRMSAVPFDHKAHEGANDTCRVCHHEAISPCVTCHSLTVPPDSDRKVNLEAAMHDADSMTSCVGCHNDRKTAKQCAGCHGFMAANRRPSDAFCKTCHMADPADALSGDDEAARRERAAALLTGRKPVTESMADADIPETVTIGAIAGEYEPAKMPHRKIFRTIEKGVREDKLATYFHEERGTLCQGCHHNSPVDKKPPKCASCHGKSFDEKRPVMPGLKAAYHRQCMECHERMGIEKPADTDCAACHKEKEQS